MYETLVIAPTPRIAQNVAGYFYLRENKPQDLLIRTHFARTLDKSRLYDWCPASLGMQAFVGAEPDRIIIAHYLEWRPHRPGDIATLGQEIDRRVAAGAERVWW